MITLWRARRDFQTFFEPATVSLEGCCSIQAELRALFLQMHAAQAAWASNPFGLLASAGPARIECCMNLDEHKFPSTQRYNDIVD